MRVAFAGTPEFACVALQRIHQAGHTVSLVLTQPDRPAGRGMQMQASAVKQYAMAHAMPVVQPRSLRLDGNYPQDAMAARAALEQADAQVLVVAAYGLLLPQWVFDVMAAPRFGCLNIHGSVLPRWRGAAPLHRAIEAGDSQSGVTIMQMDLGLDTGDMLLVQALPIADSDTTGSLHDKVAALGAELIVHALEALPRGALLAVPQPQAGVTYAHKITRQESQVDWSQGAETISRRVRAFDPFPGTVARIANENVKIWGARALPDAGGESAPAGTVLEVGTQGITVATGSGSVLLQVLQRAGGKRLAAGEFLRGFALHAGMQFEQEAPAGTTSVT